MSNQIILFKRQESRKNIYIGHDCASLTECFLTVPCKLRNDVRDPIVSRRKCAFCPDQFYCLEPDRETEAFIGLSSRGVDPLISFGWDMEPPNLICIYDADHIDTDSQLNNLHKLFSLDQYNHAMRSLCTNKRGSKCNDEKKTCSLFKSLDNIGSRCQEWLDTVESKDSIRREYCLRFDTDDCSCINRTKRKDFNELKNGMDATTIASSKCWYKPCEDNDNLLLDIEQKNTCNPNICQNIINAHANGNINIANNTSSISCNFTKQQIASYGTTTTPTSTIELYVITALIIISLAIVIVHVVP